MSEDSVREKLATLMLKHGLATGHGDTVEELLKELDWQLAELRAKPSLSRGQKKRARYHQRMFKA
jgi:energy-coupling factor transporter ATP-binding protein EcfA2